MKLTEKNIKFVKRMEMDGITYQWFVCMKSVWVSDSRNYINYNENGRTMVAEYGIDRLPKAVQNFIKNHTEEVFIDHSIFNDGDNMVEYICRA